MPTELKNRLYFYVNEVLADTGVSRQTLWRWRQNAKVPLGHRFRDRQIFFDEEEFDAIRRYATHLQRFDEGARQLGPFRTGDVVSEKPSFNSGRKGST